MQNPALQPIAMVAQPYSFQTAFAAPFDLGDISGIGWADAHCSKSNHTWSDHPEAICSTWERNMTNASWMTICVNLGAVAAFVWFMPRNAAHCREWAAKTSWQNAKVGIMNTLIFVVPFVYANFEVIRDLQGN